MKQRHAKWEQDTDRGYFNRQSTGNGETRPPFLARENGVWLTSTVAVEFLEWSFSRLGYKNNKFNILQELYRPDSAAHQVM